MMGQMERRTETISGEFQLAGGSEHAGGVCEDEDKAGGADDGAAGAADGGDIRGVQPTEVALGFLSILPQVSRK